MPLLGGDCVRTSRDQPAAVDGGCNCNRRLPSRQHLCLTVLPPERSRDRGSKAVDAAHDLPSIIQGPGRKPEPGTGERHREIDRVRGLGSSSDGTRGISDDGQRQAAERQQFPERSWDRTEVARHYDLQGHSTDRSN